ncbi:MAG: peptidoglycan-binding protein [Candidatus Limiplasma sp.]|nr:peptidoglycan-binding protein [Candidatus Limiplasma sp.]
MRKITLSPFTLALWLVLVAALVAVALLLPGTLEGYQQLQTEQNATPTPTANVQSMLLVTVDPNNTPTPTPLILRTGSQGDEVKRLQQRLLELGFYTGLVDGQYGQGTAEAVRLFQAQHGLTADGLAGNETRTLLYSESVATYIPTPVPSPTPSSLAKGDKNNAVKALQQRLKDLGFYTSSVDGDYGGGTQEAVRLFQSQHGLTADGQAGGDTLAAVFSQDAKPVVATPTPDPAVLPMLVNVKHTVADNYKPANLVNLRNTLPSDLVYVKGSEIEGDKEAVEALQALFEAAKADGVTGFQVSAGYRSVRYQQELFDAKVAEYVKEGRKKESAISATKLTVAVPGASEHHTGLAFDITVAGTIFKGTPQQVWLHKHCWDYGFIIRYQEDKEKITGILAEDWHIRYVGIQHSVIMRDENLCLEEYWEKLTQ